MSWHLLALVAWSFGSGLLLAVLGDAMGVPWPITWVIAIAGGIAIGTIKPRSNHEGKKRE